MHDSVNFLSWLLNRPGISGHPLMSKASCLRNRSRTLSEAKMVGNSGEIHDYGTMLILKMKAGKVMSW